MVSYTYARPALTVDTVVFALADDVLRILLIERALEPFAGKWALPGGFVRIDETLVEAAQRELREETGLQDIFLEQLYTFGDLQRDPRERVVSVVYYALVHLSGKLPSADTDARSAAWFPLGELPELAFDHPRIVQMALARLRAKVRYQPLGFELLPERFTLRQLQRLYEVILDRPLDKRNFRKKMLGMGILQETEEAEQAVAHRAAQFYRFDRKAYDRLTRQGFHFEL
jgi:8-oxo-dGTP diphosphatase